MQKYLTYISEFHENNPKEIEFVNNHLKKHLESNLENQTEIEIILDYLFSNPKVDISKIGYTTILEKTEKWHKKLQSVAIKDTEIDGVDYEIFMDFGDGFKIVKLISKQCYEREGKLMSHCVGSYYDRSYDENVPEGYEGPLKRQPKRTIYSLRDSKNNPHCTIEDGNQIKGKGNGSIDPKYVDYIVKFLEKTGMTVGENEMKNLGYVKIDKLKEDLGIDFHKTTKNILYKGIYYPTNKGIEKLLDSEGKEIKHLALLDYFPMFKEEEKENGWSLKIAIDIVGLASGFIEFMKKTKNKGVNEKDNCYTGGDYAKMSGGDSAKMSGGHSAQMSGGDSAKMSGGHSAKMSGGYSAQMSGGNYAQMSGGYSAKMSGGHSAQMSGGNYAQMSGGYSAQMSCGHSAQMSGGDYAQMSGGYSAKMSGGYSAQISGGNYAQMSGGYSAQMSCGHSAQMSGGDYAQMSGGYSAQMSGGNCAKMSGGDSAQMSGGNYAKMSGGDSAQMSCGHSAQISGGNYSMILASTKSKAQGKIGTLIVLANREVNFPYAINEYKAGLVDGINLKENTWYKLENGEFIETE